MLITVNWSAIVFLIILCSISESSSEDIVIDNSIPFGLVFADGVPTVKTKYGPIVGKLIEHADRGKVYAFLGVPFAKPPVGDLRFKKPVSTDPWTDPLKTDKDAEICVQVQVDMAMLSSMGEKDKSQVEAESEKFFDLEKDIQGKEIIGGLAEPVLQMKDKQGSEDCLYMNIFVPATVTADTKKAVVVMYHGGFFYGGGVGVPAYDGTAFAIKADAIAVEPQYRIGFFGFLHAASEDVPGNMGLLDQVQSLIWIQENIGAFGGDPALVSIMGMDAGGWSVGFHLVACHIKKFKPPLFNRAIMQSGSTLFPMMLFGESAAKHRFEKFAIAAKCPVPKKGEKDEFAKITPEVYECLRKADIPTLMAAQQSVLSSKKDSGFMPSEDQTYFCGNVFDLVKSGKINKVTEVMMGTNSNECGGFISAGLPDVFPPLKGEPKPYTLNELVDHIKKKANNANAGQVQMMLPMFFRGVNKKDPVAVRKRVFGLCMDGLFVCPDSLLLAALTKAKIPTYYYQFDHRPSTTVFAPWITGALHGDEYQFFMGQPLRPEYKGKYTDEEVKFSEQLIGYISKFASTGDPMKDDPAKVKWKPTTGKAKWYFQMTAKEMIAKKGFVPNSCKDLTRYYSMGRSFLKNYKA